MALPDDLGVLPEDEADPAGASPRRRWSPRADRVTYDLTAVVADPASASMATHSSGLRAERALLRRQGGRDPDPVPRSTEVLVAQTRVDPETGLRGL